MKPFTESAHCLSGAHCGTCRKLDGGRAFRASFATAFALPPAGVDFACPHGKPWGWAPPPVARPPEPIPDDFDPAVERERMRQGGCCGKPSAS